MIHDIVVAIGSRLVYRKGIDLVIGVIPDICRRMYQSDTGNRFRVNFRVGGDGPKRILLEEMIERARFAKPGGDVGRASIW